MKAISGSVKPGSQLGIQQAVPTSPSQPPRITCRALNDHRDQHRRADERAGRRSALTLEKFSAGTLPPGPLSHATVEACERDYGAGPHGARNTPPCPQVLWLVSSSERMIRDDRDHGHHHRPGPDATGRVAVVELCQSTRISGSGAARQFRMTRAASLPPG